MFLITALIHMIDTSNSRTMIDIDSKLMLLLCFIIFPY
nr:MAG TPA: hypothetical protein [Caudoviricetes sp.]